MGPGAMIFVFWVLGFKPGFSVSSFTFIKRLFSSSLLSVICRMVSAGWCHLHIWDYWYFSQQSWFQLVLHSSPAFLMMYSAYKLNKYRDSIQPWHTPFPIWNQCVVPCPVLTIASWPAYRFVKRQVRWSGIPISFRIFHSLLATLSSNYNYQSTELLPGNLFFQMWHRLFDTLPDDKNKWKVCNC